MSQINIKDINIRRAETRDIPRIINLLSDICTLHCEGRPDIFKQGRKYEVSDLEKMFADPDHPVFVADAGNGVIGYAFCIVKRHSDHPVYKNFVTLYIDDLCVDCNYRGHGIGHLLFDEVKRFATRIDAHNIDLNVWAFNKNAIKFYESLGMNPERIIMEMVLEK